MQGPHTLLIIPRVCLFSIRYLLNSAPPTRPLEFFNAMQFSFDTKVDATQCMQRTWHDTHIHHPKDAILVLPYIFQQIIMQCPTQSSMSFLVLKFVHCYFMDVLREFGSFGSMQPKLFLSDALPQMFPEKLVLLPCHATSSHFVLHCMKWSSLGKESNPTVSLSLFFLKVTESNPTIALFCVFWCPAKYSIVCVCVFLCVTCLRFCSSYMQLSRQVHWQHSSERPNINAIMQGQWSSMVTMQFTIGIERQLVCVFFVCVFCVCVTCLTYFYGFCNLYMQLTRQVHWQRKFWKAKNQCNYERWSKFTGNNAIHHWHRKTAWSCDRPVPLQRPGTPEPRNPKSAFECPKNAISDPPAKMAPTVN